MAEFLRSADNCLPSLLIFRMGLLVPFHLGPHFWSFYFQVVCISGPHYVLWQWIPEANYALFAKNSKNKMSFLALQYKFTSCPPGSRTVPEKLCEPHLCLTVITGLRLMGRNSIQTRPLCSHDLMWKELYIVQVGTGYSPDWALWPTRLHPIWSIRTGVSGGPQGLHGLLNQQAVWELVLAPWSLWDPSSSSVDPRNRFRVRYLSQNENIIPVIVVFILCQTIGVKLGQLHQCKLAGALVSPTASDFIFFTVGEDKNVIHPPLPLENLWTGDAGNWTWDPRHGKHVLCHQTSSSIRQPH